MGNEDLRNLRYVHFDQEHSVNPQDVTKIRKLLPLINKFGKMLGVKVIVDIPNGAFSRREFAS